ncbi:MAG: peptidylprolyl isomerase [Actinomycetaceae bacterium]|nr:peptidylprolyl isomerase [Actinomycetaceae bacterium]
MRFTARKRFTKADKEANKKLTVGGATDTQEPSGSLAARGRLLRKKSVQDTEPPRSRLEKRRGMKRRVWRWWREVLAILVVVVVSTTAILVINDRDRKVVTHEESWADLVEVSGRVGGTPALVVDSQVSVLSKKVTELEVGTGREITADSPLIVSMMTYSGETGKVLSEAGRPRLSVGVANAENFDQFLLDAVIGKTEGSRLLFARPVTDGSKRRTELSVVDILWSAAAGETVEDPGGPLQVSVNEAGPRLSHGEGSPPDTLKVQTLVEGNGQQVRTGDAVLAQYVSARWDDSVVVSSTWSTGIPQTIRLETAMPGVRNALLDQRVGSRLAITVPPNMAQGDTTLMIVVDILGTEPDQAK